MAQIPYRANLSAAIFPMTIAKGGRTVINPGADQNFDKRVDATGNDKSSVGIPQALYLENVMPTPEGFQSVGFIGDNVIANAPVDAMAAIKIATVTETTTIEGGGEFGDVDAGDQIETWTKSATWNGASDLVAGTPGDNMSFGLGVPAFHCEVAESSEIGNPFSSYRFAFLSNWTSSYPAYMYKNFNLSSSATVSVAWNAYFKIGTSDETSISADKYMDVRIAVTEAGAGLSVYYTSATGKLSIGYSSGGWNSSGLTEIISADLTVAYLTWYKFTCTYTVNPDNTKTVTVKVFDVADTELLTLATPIPAATVISRGNYGGFILELPSEAWGTAWIPEGSDGAMVTPHMVFYDNIKFGGGTPETEVTVTVNSGIVGVYLAFLNDGTVSWSYELSNWEDKVVSLPGTYVPPDNDSQVSVATVRGIGYLCIRKAGETHIYKLSLDEDTGVLSFEDISTTIAAGIEDGYTLDDVVAITSSFNYLILTTATTIFWSSTTTPTDFLYSLVSGAGYELPGNVKGDIVFLKEHVAGFFIYSTKNVLFAQYTGNARYPWKFREVGNSGGYEKSIQVAGDTNATNQIGINGAKLIQSISPDLAELIAPEAASYLERASTYDTFNGTTNVFTVVTLEDPLALNIPRIFFSLDRYILLPYVATSYGEGGRLVCDYVIVYDILLRRYGKLKVQTSNILTDDKFIYFINYQTGNIVQLNFDPSSVNHFGVLLLGKFQAVRDRWIQVEQVELEGFNGDSVTTFLLPTFDGKTFRPAVPLVEKIQTDDLLVYPAHTPGKNICIGIKGTFDLNTVQMQLVVKGKN